MSCRIGHRQFAAINVEGPGRIDPDGLQIRMEQLAVVDLTVHDCQPLIIRRAVDAASLDSGTAHTD